MMLLQRFPFRISEDLLLQPDRDGTVKPMDLLSSPPAVVLAGNAFNGCQFVALALSMIATCPFRLALLVLRACDFLPPH